MECRAATCGVIFASVLHPIASFGGAGVRVPLPHCLHHDSIAPIFHYSIATAPSIRPTQKEQYHVGQIAPP